MARRKVSYRRKSLSGIQKLMLCALVLLVFGLFATVILVLSPQTYKSSAAAGDYSACVPGGPPGSPGTLIPGTDGNYPGDGNTSDPHWFFGQLYDSKDISDPFFTAGRANSEGRWAGSSEYRAAFCHDRGCAYTRADKPGYPQVIGGWLYDPAYDWGRYDNGAYKNNDLVWDRTMGYVSRGVAKYVPADSANILQVNRNCVISKVIEELIADGNTGQAYSHQPFQPVISGGPSTIKIYAAGKPGNSYPTVDLVINNQFVKEWKDVRGNPDARQFLELTYTSPNKIVPGQVIVSQNSGDCNDNDGSKCTVTFIDKINIDGTDYQTEAATTFNSAQWDPSHGCTPAFGNPYPQTEMLGCKGYVRYGGSGGSETALSTTVSQAPVAQITVPPTYTPVPTLPSPVTPVTAAKSMIIAAGFIGMITMGFIVFGL